MIFSRPRRAYREAPCKLAYLCAGPPSKKPKPAREAAPATAADLKLTEPPAFNPSDMDKYAFNCCNCGQRARAAFLRTSSTRASARLSPQVGPLRYAQHLDKCMAKGGRRAAREGNEARRASAGSGNR